MVLLFPVYILFLWFCNIPIVWRFSVFEWNFWISEMLPVIGICRIQWAIKRCSTYTCNCCETQRWYEIAG